MPFQIIRDDITKVKADAIVNTANPKPKFMAGTDTAIYRAAGVEELLAERKKIGPIARGGVAVTQAFALRAKYIFHAVGPEWIDGEHGEFTILRNCYKRALVKAAELGCKSIAFPLIASGVNGFPKDQALQIAIQEISAFLMKEDTEMTIILVVFDERAFMLSKSIFLEVEEFIDDEEYRRAHLFEYGIERNDPYGSGRTEALHRRRPLGSGNRKPQDGSPLEESRTLPGTSAFGEEDVRPDVPEDLSFQTHLLKLLREKNISNATVYKNSNVTKGAFSKILCGDTKRPQKKTVLGLCIGLRLDLSEARDLLASADLAFNPYSKRDRMVMRFIEDGNYDIMSINIALFACGQQILG